MLADDDLATVVAAVEEGRRVYANIRRFLRLRAVRRRGRDPGDAARPVRSGCRCPLLPAQILWINLLTHGLPGVALGAEPVEPGTMEQAPRGSRSRASSVAGCGGALSLIALFLARWGRPGRDGTQSTRCGLQTAALLTLGASQLGVAWGLRARDPAGERRGARGRGLVPGTPSRGDPGGRPDARSASVLAPPLRTLLGTEPVGRSAAGSSPA